MELAGAHALVTGATRGIGARIAAQLAGAGACVTLVARNAAELAARADELGARGLAADLSDAAQRAGLVARAERQADGPVDVLVNCAGLDGVAAFADVDSAVLEHVVQVNLIAPMELSRQAVPGMRARGRGHVVNVSSGFSASLAPGLTPYCASKAGLSHFTAGLRLELAGTGVHTTLVELGPVRTSMYGDIERHRLAGPALKRLLRLRMVRAVEPEAVAQQVVAAIRHRQAHVVLPRRMLSAVAPTWAPRRATQMLLTGLPKH